MFEKNEIIGFINSIPITIFNNNKSINFQYVDYLCIGNKHRNRNIATVLITSLINSFESPNLAILFKKEGSSLPFNHLVKSHYFVKDLSSLQPSQETKIKEINVFNFYYLFEYVNRLLSRYKFHRKYSKREFFEMFIEKKILNLFIINNESENDTIIIGKKTIYYVYNNVFKRFASSNFS